jgi:hypothetical protein
MQTNNSPGASRQESESDSDDNFIEAPPISPEAPSPKWKRQFIGEGQTPEHALTWRTRCEKNKLLRAWRNWTGKAFPESGRILRIAWTLEGL